MPLAVRNRSVRKSATWRSVVNDAARVSHGGTGALSHL